MTVPSQDPISVSTANGVTSVFPYNFRILAATDLYVEDGGIARTLGVHYTVDGVGVAGGGNVTFLPAFLPANGNTVVRKRLMEYKRTDDFQTGGELRAIEVNKNYDSAVMQIQQLASAISRTLQLPDAAAGGSFNATLPAYVPGGFFMYSMTTPYTVEVGSTVGSGDLLLRGDLAASSSNKGSDLTAFPDSLAPAYLKTVSDMLNGMEVSIDRFITKSKLPAIRNGTSVDILTAHFQEAADAFDSLGYGNWYLPRGRYNLDAEIVLAFNGRIRGDGVGATVVRLMTAAQNGFRLSYSGFVVFEGIDFVAGVAKTDGAALLVDGLGGSSAQQTRIHHCRFSDQFYAINMDNGGYWTISQCGIFESVQAGIRVDNTMNYDAGDNLIQACVIQKTALTAGTAGVLQVASGGTKLLGNKILGHDRGYALTPRVGALSVIDTQLVGNSIEDGNIGVFIQTANAGTTVGQMTLVGNQMSNKANGIILQGAAAGIEIAANQIACNFVNHIGIYLDSLNGSPSQVNCGPNQISGNSSAGSIGIYGGNLANVKLVENQISGCASPYSNVANTIVRGFELSFAQLPVMGNGSYGYCTDGTVANPVAGAGTGCFAKRLNGAWVGN